MKKTRILFLTLLLIIFSKTMQVNVAHASVGSAYIARAPGTNIIVNIDGSENILTYDAEVQSSVDIARQTGNQAFRIQNTGRYLIVANTRFSTIDIGNNNRHVMRSQIKVGGSVLPSIYGMASGFGRDSGNSDEDGVVIAAYLDHTVVGGSGDDVTIHVQNFGDTSVSLADQISDQSGIQIIRLPDDGDYLKVQRTSDITFTGTMDYSINDPTWNEFGWESQDAETDTAVLEWSSGNDITLKSAGHYMVIYSIRGDTTGTVRKGATYRLKLSDTEIPSSRVVSYMRGSDGSEESWVQWAGIVEASADDVLNIDWASASETAGGILNEATMTVVKLPDDASYLRIHYDSNRAGETTGAYPFNVENEDDEGVHDNITNNSRISGDSNNRDWLLFGSWFLRNIVADSTRTSEHFRWFRTGSEINYGSGLSYTRGDQSTTGVPAGGRNAILVAHSLGSSEYIEFNLTLESGTGDQNRDFVSNQVGITGVALDTLVSAPEVSISLNTDGSIALGTVALNTSEDTTAVGIDDTEIISVDSGPADLDVKSSVFSDGSNTWTLSTGIGSDQVRWEFSSDGSAWTNFATVDTFYSLAASVSQSSTQNIDFKLTLPTTTSSYSQHSATVTIQASSP